MSRKELVVGSAPWYIDQAVCLMKLENQVQTFLGLEEATEDVFFRGQRCNMRINDQHSLLIFLDSSQGASSTSSRAQSCLSNLPTR